MTIVPVMLLLVLAADPPVPPVAPPAAAPAAAPAAVPAKAPAKARAEAKPAPARTPPVASLPTVAGEILEIDHRAHRLRLRTAGGELLLTFDRNTLVSGPSGAATAVQLVPGARVTAGRDGEARAAWVEVSAPPSAPGTAP